MTTAAVVVNDALGEILEQAAETPVQAADFQLAIRMMNNMVASWNLALGYTVVTDPNDELTVIDGAIMAIQKNLALQLANSFDHPLDLGLVRSAKGSLGALRRMVISVQPSKYPSRLPVGSGNNRTTTFYPPQGAELVQEGGGSILLED